MADDDYTLLSSKEVSELKQDMEYLKKNPLGGSHSGKTLQESIDKLNESISELIEIFKEASDMMKAEERESDVIISRIAPIEKRLDERLKEGMIAEVKRLHARGVSWKRLDGFGLEYRWVSRYIRGMISKEEMREKLFRAICHFAKRQMTWFRRDKDIHWMGDAKEVFGLIRKFLK